MFFLKNGFKRSLGLFHSFMPDIDHTTSNALIALFCPRIDLMLMMTRMILAIDDTDANADDYDDVDDDEVCSANTPAATPYSKWDSALKTNKRTDFLN